MKPSSSPEFSKFSNLDIAVTVIFVLVLGLGVGVVVGFIAGLAF